MIGGKNHVFSSLTAFDLASSVIQTLLFLRNYKKYKQVFKMMATPIPYEPL